MRTLTIVSSLVAAVLFVACGSSDVSRRDYGEPPDAAQFNPGSGGGGNGYGSGGQTGTSSFVCPPELRQCGETFTLPDSGYTSVELRGDYRDGAWQTGDVLTKIGTNWTVAVQVPLGKPVQYKYFVNGTTWLLDPVNTGTYTDGGGNTNSLASPVTCDDFTCADPPVPPPGVYDWRDAVMYFVFVDRFVDGGTPNCNVGGTSSSGQANGNYEGGDWKGVTSKIDSGYFTDLGVNTLWITVPVKNADTDAYPGVGGDNHTYSAYHGYWPTDLNALEPCFGAQQDLKDLVDHAHAKNLKILFDFGMVLTTVDAPVYTQHPDWFWPNQNPSGSGDCVCGQGCDWNTDGLRCWFAPYLPHWNYTNADARSFSVNAAVSLAKNMGIDGYRLDAIKQVDSSWLTQLRSQIQSQIIASQPIPQRFYMVGETYDFDQRDYIKSFIDPATKLDGQFDFPLRKRLVESVVMRKYTGMNDLAAYMDSNLYYYGANAVMSTFLGNHDLPRIIHLAEDNPMWSDQASDGKDRSWSSQPTLPNYRSPFERVANAFAVLLTNQGIPLIYYGDEIGMNGAGDPDNRHMMYFSGWTADQTYLHDRIAMLTKIRAAHPALRRGHRTTIGTPTADVWAYSMATAGDQLWVAINRGDSDQQVTGLPTGTLKELVTSATATGPTVTIPARQTRIFTMP
ncbi:MAG: alpha-amylase family glycosyl hydrolase [Polyangiaceae bacterium]